MGVVKRRGKWGIEWYNENGRRKRKVIEKEGEKPEGGWYEEAKKAYRDTKARLDRGEPPLFATSKKTVAEIAATYLKVCPPTWSPKEAVRVRGMLTGHLLPFFGTKRMSSVKQIDVESYVAKRRAEHVTKPCPKHKNGERCPRCNKSTSPTTINKEVMRLRNLFNKAIAWGELHRNPCQGVKRLREPPERVAFLDGDERSRLLAACGEFNQALQDIVTFAMFTGARLSEILTLMWGTVDLKRRIVTFRKTKSGKVRHVPIHPDLHALLLRLEPSPNPEAPVFPPEWNAARVAVAFRRVAQRAGLTGFRFHDLRHDFCSWLTMRGVPMRAVQQLAGHADLRMTERYSHLAERVLVDAVQVLPALPGNGSGHGVTEPVSVVSGS